MYKVLNKQIEYPLLGIFSGSFYGTASYASTASYAIINWGSIIGSLSNQTDLNNAFNNKQNIITTGSNLQYYRGDFSLATFPTGISSFTNDLGYITSSSLQYYVPYTGSIADVNIGAFKYFGAKLQLGTPTLNSPINFQVAIKSTTVDGLYLEGAAQTRLLLQAHGMSGGNGQIEIFAGLNNNSYIRLGLTYLRENSGLLAVGGSNFSPTATLHVRGASTTTGNVLNIENSGPVVLFQVPNTVTSNILVGNNTIQIGQSGNTTGKSIQPYWGGSTAYGFNITDNLGSITAFVSSFGIGLGNANSYVLNTTGAYSMVRVYVNSFAPTAGTVAFNSLLISGVINQTGTATGITRGLLINQTLTSATNYRGLEVITRNSANDLLLKLTGGTTDVICVTGDLKIGLFGATPIVKATTAYASATINSPGGGANIKTDDTFEGYTIAQVIRYLKDLGLLT